MARITKNGLFSGVIGNVVFVQNGNVQYARSKPANVKQSPKTKAAASVFGWMSTKDKSYRRLLLEKYPIVTDSRYAARHRARMGKTLVTATASTTSPSGAIFQNPEALLGFEFNNELLWTNVTQFFPEFTSNSGAEVQCKIPGLHWGEQIKAPKNSTKATVTFEAFSVNPQTETMEIVSLSTWRVQLSYGQMQEATEWNFDVSNIGSWLLVLASVNFSGDQSALRSNQKNAAAYLWAKNFGDDAVLK